MNVPITFPLVLMEDIGEEPLIVEVDVEGYLIRRVYVDEGASVDVMFKHCFKNLSLTIKARLKETQTDLVGFVREAFLEFIVSEEEGLYKGYDSYGSRSTTVAPTHSAFIGGASTNTKLVYSDQPSYSFLISYTPAPSGSIMEDVLHSFVAENEPTQQLAYEDFEQNAGKKINFNNKDSTRFDRRKARCYNCLQLEHFARECNVKKVDEKARYSAFKISDVKIEEPKAMVSVDSMLNWNEHDAENKTEEAEQVYGLMARFESDFTVHANNATGGVHPTAVEFAMMGISPKAKHEKKEWEVKFVESLARFDKWKESSKNLAKLLYSSMSTRTKLGLGFKEYSVSDEVCDLSTPSVFDPKPDNREVKSLYESVKSSASETYYFASCVLSPKTNYSFSTVDVKLLPKSDIKDPSLTNGLPSCSFKENVKPPRNLCNKCGTADRIPYKNTFVRTKKYFIYGSKSHLIKDYNVHDTVDNFSYVVSKAASVPAGSRNSSASIFTGRSIPAACRNESASIHAGRSIPAASRNKPASIHAGKHIPAGRINKLAPFPVGNKEKLDDFVQVKGGTFTFRDGDELQNFNLFSVSQICDKKNKVLFIDNECLVLTKEFQLPDESQAVSAVRTISEPLQLLHMDLFGPTSIRSIDHKYYSLVVSDDFSRFCWAFFLGTKDETLYILKDFIALIENQLNKKIKAIRCDNGTEFQNAKLIALCEEKGIKRDYSNARTPQQNGVAERKNQILIEAARSIKKFEKTLNLRYLEDKPNVQGLGQEWYFDLDYLTDSLGYKRFKTNPPAGTHATNMLTGTQADDSESECDEQHGFEFSVDTAALLPQAKIEIRRNLVPAAGDPAGSIVPTGGVPSSSVPASSVPGGGVLDGSIVPTGGVPAGSIPASGVPTGSVPASSVPAGGVLAGCIVSAEFGDPAASASILDILTTAPAATAPLPLALNVAVDHVATKRVNIIHPQSQIIRALQSPVQTRKPSSVVKALKDPDWVAAMQEEMQQFYNQQGIVVRNKAILVAQGHRQEEGIDYNEVFASVARIEAIQLFLAFASYMGFMVYQMDIKSAFLYGEIEEEVYVTQPKGFEDPHNPKHVYRVVKALYGLHQAPRDWYARLSTFLLKHHYRRAWCDEFEVLMKGEFEMSAMGELTFFLGLQVKQLPDGIFISQDKYVKDMLKKFDMESVRTATTPYKVPKHKSKDDPDDAINVYVFRSMIGSLMYLIASRPDIMFAVSACSRHQVTPLTSHLNAVKKIFKYLKGQPNLVSCGLLLYYVSNVSGYPKLQVVQVLLLVVLVRADNLVPAGSCIIPTGPSSAPQVIPDPTPVREPTPRPVREPTPDSPRPPSPPSKTEEVGPTRPPSPTRHTSIHEDISEGGGDFVSSPQYNEAPQTPTATAVGGAEDSAALTALSFKLDRCLHKVTTLENNLGITKKVLGGAILKLVTRVKRLEGLLQQRKRRLVLSDSEGDDATPTEHDIDIASLHTLDHTSLGSGSFDQAAGPDAAEVPADTTMPFRSSSTMPRRLRKMFTTFASAHVPKNIPAGVSVPTTATTIPTGSSVAADVHAAAAPSSFIPIAADKGQAPMVDDSLPADLLTEQECVLKNLHNSQLGEELAKKIHAEQEAEFSRQQEELAQKA
nr:putative ribonuclease H-like domain-containing protein [Tanacetum cinerariifolium]